jgi:hypothetical protein
MLRLIRDRRADAYAWFAVLMVLVGLPLSSLSIDVTRLMYVRGHLHTATDAACQAAADALDVPLYVSTGQVRINPGLARSQAGTVFASALQDAGKIGYGPGLSVGFPGPTFAHCIASASVAHIIPMTPPMDVTVETTSEMRVRTLR